MSRKARGRATDETQDPGFWFESGNETESSLVDRGGEVKRTRDDECAVHAPNTTVDRFSEPRWKVGRALCRWDNPG